MSQFGKLGHDVTLISAKSKHVTKPRYIKTTFVPLRFLPLLSPIMFTIILSFYLPIAILTLKPDVLILAPDYSIFASFPALIICKLKKIKRVLDVRSVPVETKGLRGNLEKYCFLISTSLVRKFFEGITVITKEMYNYLLYSYPIGKKKFGIWSSGVSDSDFDPEKHENEAFLLKKKLGLTENFIVFYHGVFTESRGLKETIKAIKLLRNKHPNIILFLLGTGPIVNVLKLLIRNYSLEENVIIHNQVKQSDVPSFIAMCDLPIVPLPNNSYWRYQSPLKLLEYLAMEKTVILTDLPAHKSIVGNTKCGIYLSSTEPQIIAEVIENAYINRRYLKTWGRIGRKIIQEKFTWKKVTEELENYLNQLNLS